MDLEKKAFVECCESSDAVDTTLHGSGISPLTGYIRKVVHQPAELWLACTLSDAVDNDQLEVVSPEVKEASVVNGFVRYVEAVCAEPLEKWLCPSCEVEFPDTDEPSFGDVVAQSVDRTWTEAESDVALVTSCLHRILSKPDSFWLISRHAADSVSDKSMELDLPLCSPLHMPHTRDVFSDPQPEPGSACPCDFWLSKSSGKDHLEEMGFVISDANDMAVSFDHESASKCFPLGKVASNFSSNYYFALLESKPTDYWLYSGNEQLPSD